VTDPTIQSVIDGVGSFFLHLVLKFLKRYRVSILIANLAFLPQTHQ
jgi:hypothetical protein